MVKILVAEDSHALANLFKFVLESAGFDVQTFPTGSEAYEAAHRESFDVLLLDQQMPEMTGVEVATAVRQQAGPNQTSPIFLCTAKTHELDLEEIQTRLSLTGVFHKPFSPKEMAERLWELASAEVGATNS